MRVTWLVYVSSCWFFSTLTRKNETQWRACFRHTLVQYAHTTYTRMEREARRHYDAGFDDDLSDGFGAADISTVVEKSGFAYMREHASRFDDHFVRRKMWNRVGIDESEWGGDQLVGKVREGGGKVGGGKESMSKELRERIEGRWSEIMGPRGFETYDDFRRAIRESYASPKE